MIGDNNNDLDVLSQIVQMIPHKEGLTCFFDYRYLPSINGKWNSFIGNVEIGDNTTVSKIKNHAVIRTEGDNKLQLDLSQGFTVYLIFRENMIFTGYHTVFSRIGNTPYFVIENYQNKIALGDGVGRGGSNHTSDISSIADYHLCVLTFDGATRTGVFYIDGEKKNSYTGYSTIPSDSFYGISTGTEYKMIAVFQNLVHNDEEVKTNSEFFLEKYGLN